VPATPFRAYDSRWSGGAGALANANRIVSVRDARDPETGLVTTANAVPAGASAVTFNLTIADTVGQGFLSVAPGTASSSGSSTINWSASGQILANASASNLDTSRNVKVFAGGGGSTQFVIDITGYYI